LSTGQTPFDNKVAAAGNLVTTDNDVEVKWGCAKISLRSGGVKLGKCEDDPGTKYSTAPGNKHCYIRN
jgi:hypothetical protein